MSYPIKHKPRLTIALTGYAGAGKDTVADYLYNTANFRVMAFAEPLKQAICAAFQLPHNMFSEPYKNLPNERLFGLTPRETAQLLGTEGFRNAFGPDIFANLLLARIERNLSDLVVVTDVRFQSEVDALNKLNAHFIRVYRPGYKTDGGVAGHASGQHHKLKFPTSHFYTLNNGGSLTDLYDQVDKVVGPLLLNKVKASKNSKAKTETTDQSNQSNQSKDS